MRQFALVSAAVAAIMSCASAASGAVKYEFHGPSVGDFIFTWPQYITSGDQSLSPSQLSLCHLASTLGPASCSGVDMLGNYFGHDVVEFDYRLPSGLGAANLFYFSPTAFTTPGLHLTNWGYGQGTLRVVGVPEPAAWTMLILGLGLAGLAARRRKACAWA